MLDESGQATPQAAVGAILRANRVIVVGDPLQIEPVVTLPQPLVQGICAHFGVTATEDAAPFVSAQVFADRASPFGASYQTREGSRQVGLPLLVHRRCADPMFSISNQVAYANLMVHATPTLTPNLLNVAVTRAQQRLYVIGNRRHWSRAGLFTHLAARLPPER